MNRSEGFFFSFFKSPQEKDRTTERRPPTACVRVLLFSAAYGFPPQI